MLRELCIKKKKTSKGDTGGAASQSVCAIMNDKLKKVFQRFYQKLLKEHLR